MMTTNRLAAALLLLNACGLSLTVPQGDLEQIARDVHAIGHPMASYEGAELVGASAGGCSTAKDRFIDVKTIYRSPLRKQDDEMVVRFWVESVQPCKVTTEVLSDTGPRPVLLDNKTMGGAVGQHVCDVIGGSSDGSTTVSGGGVTVEINTDGGDDQPKTRSDKKRR